MLIRDRLEAAFETEPQQVPIEQRLAAGRAALRRRRIGQSVTAVAAVAAISVGAVALGGRSADPGRLAPATDGGSATTTTTRSDVPKTTAQPQAWPYPDQLAYVDDAGRLQLATDVSLIRKVSTPAKPPDDWAIQVAVRSQDEVWWLAMTWQRGKEATAYTLVGPFDSFQSPRFRDWVLQQSFRASYSDPTSTTKSSHDATGQAISADEQLVHFENGKLLPEAGVVILQERPDPGFANFSPEGEAVAVAEIRVENDGTRWFVVARDNGDGTTQNISARPAVGPVPSDLDGFIAWARHRYDSGVGLL